MLPTSYRPHWPAPNRSALHQAGVAVLLAAAAFTALLPSRCAIPAVPCPYAGLLPLCAAFHDADARCEAAPDDGKEWLIWLSRRWDVSDAIEGMAPRTEGRRLSGTGQLLRRGLTRFRSDHTTPPGCCDADQHDIRFLIQRCSQPALHAETRRFMLRSITSRLSHVRARLAQERAAEGNLDTMNRPGRTWATQSE